MSASSAGVVCSGSRKWAALHGARPLFIIGCNHLRLLIRIFWIRKFSPRLILGLAFLCLVATSLGFFASLLQSLGGWWLTAVWWFAFSGGLYFFDT